jgi:lipopolysaccharide export system permease protein
MPILTRYVLAEFLKVFLVTLTSLTLLMLIVFLGKEAVDQGLGLAQVLEIIPFVLPNALLFTVPGTTLFAACLVYGRLSSSNEVLAVKAVGVSPMELVWPALWLSVVLSLFTAWLNDIAWSWGYQGIQRVVLEAGEEIAYSMLRMHRTYTGKHFSINVKDVRDRRLIQATITFYSNDRGTTTITAEEAELRSDLRNDTLIVSCRNFTLDMDGKVSVNNTGVFEREISLKEFRQRDPSYSPSRMSLARIRQEQLEVAAQIEEMKQEQAVLASMQMLQGNFDGLIGGEWLIHAAQMQERHFHLCKLNTEPYRRWANGFSCLCFVLVGIPTAIRLRNSDVFTSFIACFFPILLVYYPLLMFGMDRAKAGALPPMTVWLGNGILALAGIWQLRKVIRY